VISIFRDLSPLIPKTVDRFSRGFKQRCPRCNEGVSVFYDKKGLKDLDKLREAPKRKYPVRETIQ
jgi:hypothetical protein